MTTFAWVVGATGLLGSAIHRELSRRDDWEVQPVTSLPWTDTEEFPIAVRAEVGTLLDASCDANEDSWCVIWAAGAAVTASTPQSLDAELAQLQQVLDIVASEAQARRAAARGSIFYASSAGGVYAGSENPPFDERSVPAPLAPYGRFKLDAESLVEAFSARSGVPALIGRIANLYGPGQRLDKMQGLISHLAKAQLSPQPASIFVSLDTLRDYIYVDDCAALIADSVARLLAVARHTGATVVVKNLASGQAVTISELLGHFRLLAKGHPHVMLGTSAAAALQAHDLRVRSVVWPELDARQMTPLPVGIKSTIADILELIQKGGGAVTRR